MIDEIIKFISTYQNITVKKINKSSHLIKDLGMSSLDVMQLACAFEDKYSIELKEEDLIDLLTVQDIANYIETKIEGVNE